MSSGRISTGVWHWRTKSRVTVKTKSGSVRYILVRNFSTCSIVISGRRFDQLRPPALHVVVVEQVAHLGARAARLRQHRGDDAVRRALDQVPDQGAADAEAQHHELVDAEMIHQRRADRRCGNPRAGRSRAGLRTGRDGRCAGRRRCSDIRRRTLLMALKRRRDSRGRCHRHDQASKFNPPPAMRKQREAAAIAVLRRPSSEWCV